MKVRFRGFVVWLLLAAICLAVPAGAVSGWKNPYSDVAESRWNYSYIRDLNQAGVLPDRAVFGGSTQESRENVVACIYALHLALGGEKVTAYRAPFEDVPKSSPNAAAITWAKNNGIVNGVSETNFAPADAITRQDICTILMRYADYAGIRLERKMNAAQFLDSLRVSSYARTPVLACQMAGIVTGYPNGTFRPTGNITRDECAAVLWRLMDAAKHPASDGKYVSTKPGVYDALYKNFTAFDPLIPAGEAVDLSYFDDVVFVGDSVSLMLQYYCAATKALGNASFLCAGSLSATNALWAVSDQSVHPSYQGKKMLVEDGVAASGAKIVYIMLGMNNISFGLDKSTGDMVELIERIEAKSPGVRIVVESVTPMAQSSNIISDGLNNDRIKAYNQRMREICAERFWYFLDVSEVVTGQDGYLPADYCSDNGSMGIHFTNSAAAVWVDYLKNHVPEALVEK